MPLWSQTGRCQVIQLPSIQSLWRTLVFTNAMPPTSMATCLPMPTSMYCVRYHINLQKITIILSVCWNSVNVNIEITVDHHGSVGTVICSVSVDATPRILRPRTALVKVIEGSRAWLDCRYFGSPVPDLSWWEHVYDALLSGVCVHACV